MNRNTNTAPGIIALHQLAPWRKPLSEEHEIRLNGSKATQEKRFQRKVARHTLKHRLAGRLIHASQEKVGDEWVGVTWHGYDNWLEENGARK